MRALVNYEASGTLRRALAAHGWDAWSCDLRPAEDGETLRHIVGDARVAAYEMGPWDLMIAHPPCTYLTVAAAWCMYHPDDKLLPADQRRPHPRFPERRKQQDDAAADFMAMVNAPIEMIAVENPVGVMSSRYRSPDDILQPYEFGHDASKKTALHLKNLPRIRRDPELRVPGRLVMQPNGRTLERWANQTDSGQNRESPGEDRWRVRSLTFEGIAWALAEQFTAHYRRRQVIKSLMPTDIFDLVGAI